jgi:FixJ family two-component response regulator
VDILDVAGASNVPLNVIVVGAFPDTHSYLSAMERGAFDFVTPPFEREPLSFVVRSAELDARRRREATAITGVA